MADLQNAAQEIVITDEGTGNKCNPLSDGTLPIGGIVASGATATTAPVVVAGADSNNKVRPLLTDTSGALQVVVVGTQAGSHSIQLLYSQAVTIINASRWFDLLRYYVPTGYKLELLKFQARSTQNGTEARVTVETPMGSFSNVTNSFTDGGSYAAPRFAASMLLHVTTGGFTTANDNITITYVNQDGVAGRTATGKINRNAVVNDIYPVTLQAGDYGVRDVTNVTHSAANTTGVFEVEGHISAAYLTCPTGNVQYETDCAGYEASEGSQVEIQYMGANGTLRDSLIAILRPI